MPAEQVGRESLDPLADEDDLEEDCRPRLPVGLERVARMAFCVVDQGAGCVADGDERLEVKAHRSDAPS